MKKKLAGLSATVAVLASSFAFMGTPQASAMYDGSGFGGCYYTYGWALLANGNWIPVLIQHC